MLRPSAKFSLFFLLSLTAPIAVLAADPATAPASPPAATESSKPAATTDSKPTSDTAETYRLLKLFGDVFERARAQYVEPVSDAELVEAALNGMLSHLDPHSSYMNQQEFRDMQVQTRGQFGGLGIEVTMESGAVKVVSPIDDTPAKRAGMVSGDLIVALDGQPVTGMSLQEAVNKMRGPVGTIIKLTVVRKGAGEPLQITLTRAVIRVESVRAQLIDNVGYVRITSFTDRTQDGLNKALADFDKEAGDKLQGIVLDLRDDPGGLLEQAVSVSDTFLNAGEIVSTRARNSANNQRFNATPGDKLNGKPIVVLINAGSASASEIVSGALQDHKRAIILGVKSFGKGSVQTISPITGYGAIRLTTARYYTPSGRSIQAEGIVPDIVVEQAKIEQLEDKGLSFHEADLKGALRNEQANKPDANTPPAPTPDASKPDANAQPNAEGKTLADPKTDYQLSRAVDLIHGLSLYTGAAAQPVAPPAPAPQATPTADTPPKAETPQENKP